MLRKVREQVDRETLIWLISLIILYAVLICGALSGWTQIIERMVLGK
ncbi:MAG: hypothetical protein OEZ48_16185 [Candidatus Bathyarchaeota archaeon]|nr:hypothetical protein [Candidatus Bathyarchaeota archaeon]